MRKRSRSSWVQAFYFDRGGKLLPSTQALITNVWLVFTKILIHLRGCPTNERVLILFFLGFLASTYFRNMSLKNTLFLCGFPFWEAISRLYCHHSKTVRVENADSGHANKKFHFSGKRGHCRKCAENAYNVGINKFLNLSKFHALQYLAFQWTRTLS